MAIEMLFNNKIQKTIFWTEFTFKTRNKIIYSIEGNSWINFQNFHLDKLSIRYEW
jgi:hypothetical protein